MSESASGGRKRSPDFFVKYIFSFGRDLPEARDVNASADKLALRAVPRNVHEVFSGSALRAVDL